MHIRRDKAQRSGSWKVAGVLPQSSLDGRILGQVLVAFAGVANSGVVGSPC